MNLTFDKQKYLKNIQTVMEQRGIKANEIEAGVGIYSGYISRLKGTDDKIPPLDVAWKIAKFLNINMEDLIEGNFDASSASLDYVKRFIQRLYSETVADKIEWQSTTIASIDFTMLGKEKKWVPALEYDAGQDFGTCQQDDEALMIGHENGSYLSYGHWRIKSYTQPYSYPWVEDTCYSFDMNPTQTLYVTPYGAMVHKGDPMEGFDEPELELWYELVIVTKENGKPKTVTPVCNTLGKCEPISADVARLYQEIKQNVSNFHIFSQARSAIDSFMYETDPDFDKDAITETIEPV